MRAMTPSALVRARRATHLAFFVFGAVMATFGVQVPSIRAQYRRSRCSASPWAPCCAWCSPAG
jgi:hypothetical protein